MDNSSGILVALGIIFLAVFFTYPVEPRVSRCDEKTYVSKILYSPNHRLKYVIELSNGQSLRSNVVLNSVGDEVCLNKRKS